MAETATLDPTAAGNEQSTAQAREDQFAAAKTYFESYSFAALRLENKVQSTVWWKGSTGTRTDQFAVHFRESARKAGIGSGLTSLNSSGNDHTLRGKDNDLMKVAVILAYRIIKMIRLGKGTHTIDLSDVHARDPVS